MAKQGKKRSGKRGSSAADAGVNVRLGTAIRAVTDARRALSAKRRQAADKQTIDRFIDAARAFLVVWKCQGKTMTRRF